MKTLTEVGLRFAVAVLVVGAAVSVWGQDEATADEEWARMPYLDNYCAGLKKVAHNFPPAFSLKKAEGNYYSSDEHYENQGSCGECYYFAVVQALEIEAKRRLVEAEGLCVSEYPMDLSETELVRQHPAILNVLRSVGDLAHTVTRVTPDVSFTIGHAMKWRRWVIPFETSATLWETYETNDCSFLSSTIPVDPPGVRVTSEFWKVCTYEDVLLVKRALMHWRKGVMVGLKVPEHEPFDYLDKDRWVGRNHAVVIVGWNDEASMGPSWIVHNSYGEDAHEDPGHEDHYHGWFYLKHGRHVANKKYFYVVGDIEFNKRERFISALYDERHGTTWDARGVDQKFGYADEVVDQKLKYSGRIGFKQSYWPARNQALGDGTYTADVYYVTYETEIEGEGLVPVPSLGCGLRITSNEPPAKGERPLWAEVREIDHENKKARFGTYLAYLRKDPVGNVLNDWLPQGPHQTRIAFQEYGVDCDGGYLVRESSMAPASPQTQRDSF